MKIKFSVPDMHCSMCTMRLEGIEDDLPGIHKVEASYHKQEMEVDYDAAIVSETQIIEAVARLGYHAILIK